jgi:uncharacterized protein (DUF58 family)
MAALILGLCINSRLFGFAYVIAFVIVLGLAWPWLAMRFVSASVEFDKSRVREGRGARIQITLRNRLPIPVFGLILQDGHRNDLHHQAGITLATIDYVKPFRTQLFDMEFNPQHFGQYPFDSAVLISGFPFGIWNSARRVVERNRLTVWPKTRQMAPMGDWGGTESDSNLTNGFFPIVNGELSGVRPYRWGDPIRLIHWPLTARHDRIVVCDRHIHQVTRVQIVAVASRGGSDNGDEWRDAIRTAASVAEHWLQMGSLIEVVLANRYVPQGNGAGHRRMILDALATAIPSSDETLDRLLRGSNCRRFGGDVQIVVATTIAIESTPPAALSWPHQCIVEVDNSYSAECGVSVKGASGRQTERVRDPDEKEHHGFVPDEEDRTWIR